MLLAFLDPLIIRLVAEVPPVPYEPSGLRDVPEELRKYMIDPAAINLKCDSPCTVLYEIDEAKQIITVTVIVE